MKKKKLGAVLSGFCVTAVLLCSGVQDSYAGIFMPEIPVPEMAVSEMLQKGMVPDDRVKVFSASAGEVNAPEEIRDIRMDSDFSYTVEEDGNITLEMLLMAIGIGLNHLKITAEQN